MATFLPPNCIHVKLAEGWKAFARGGFGTIYKNGTCVVKIAHTAKYYEANEKTKLKAQFLGKQASALLQKEVQFIHHMIKISATPGIGDVKNTLKSVLLCDYFAWMYGECEKQIIVCPMFECGADFIDHFNEDIKPLVKSHPDIVKTTVIDIVCCLLNGLYAVHVCGIFHRDIKPDNLIYFPNKTGLERYKICDFGLSSFLSKDGKDTGIRGSKDFFPPEFFEDSKYFSEKYRGDLVDVWAAGRSILAIVNEAENPNLVVDKKIISMYSNDPAKRPTSRELYETYVVKGKSIFNKHN
jgi:serine/threonine protein kinase